MKKIIKISISIILMTNLSNACVCTVNIMNSFKDIRNEVFNKNIDPIAQQILPKINTQTTKQISIEKDIVKQLKREIKLETYLAMEIAKQKNYTNIIKNLEGE